RHLRVGSILHLEPDYPAVVGVRRTLADDPLEVEPLHGFKEVTPLVRDHQRPREKRGSRGYQLLELGATLNERLLAEITPIEPKEIESRVMEMSKPGHQAPEVVLAGVVDREDFTVEDGSSHFERFADVRRQPGESPEDQALPRDERRLVTVDVE